MPLTYTKYKCPNKRCQGIFHDKPPLEEGSINWCPYCSHSFTIKNGEAINTDKPIRREGPRLPYNGHESLY